MPVSLDPQPGEDEIECARCGAIMPLYVTRCPRCGVNLYEPDDDLPQPTAPHHSGRSWLGRLQDWFTNLTGKPYAVEELFGASLDQASLFNDLLLKVGGDRNAAERLVDYERKQLPTANRSIWLRNALQRWERDNQPRHNTG